MVWKCRLAGGSENRLKRDACSGVFEVATLYTADESMLGNTFTVEIGDEKVEGKVAKTGRHVVDTLGRVRLSPGACTLAVKPGKIRSGDLMRLTDVRLIPIR